MSDTLRPKFMVSIISTCSVRGRGGPGGGTRVGFPGVIS